MRPDIEMHIEELVLHGFPPGDRLRIGEAVERELARLLGVRGLPPSFAQGGQISLLDGGTFEATSREQPEIIGARVARAVYQCLEQEHTGRRLPK